MNFLSRKENKERTILYVDRLKEVFSLSRLFSPKDANFLDPKILEYIFCSTFNTYRVSQDNKPFDSVTNAEGVAIKTFCSSSTAKYEKISQFKHDELNINIHSSIPALSLAKQVMKAYNRRIKLAMHEYDVKEAFYHVVLRNKDRFDILQYPLNKISLSRIKIDHAKSNINQKSHRWTTVYFSVNDACFRYATCDHQLYYHFRIPQELSFSSNSRLRSPLSFIHKASESRVYSEPTLNYNELPFFITPLYSLNRYGKKFVAPAGGINNWKSSPRQNQKRRNHFEVYLPFNKQVKDNSGSFFPAKGIPFCLLLPDGQEHQAKITSGDDRGKGISTSPNKYLGLWLLKTMRNKIKDDRFRVITYKDLEKFGSDCIIFFKLPYEEIKYEVYFAPLDFFEKFAQVGFNFSNFPQIDFNSFLTQYKYKLNAL